MSTIPEIRTTSQNVFLTSHESNRILVIYIMQQGSKKRVLFKIKIYLMRTGVLNTFFKKPRSRNPSQIIAKIDFIKHFKIGVSNEF